MNYYNEQKNAKAYLNFLDSSDGQIQQEFLYLAIKKELDILKPQKIIEAGCGTGWLCSKILNDGFNIYGFDGSEILLNIAERDYPKIDFKLADVQKELPYEKNSFDVAILNVMIHDVEDQIVAMKNLFDVTSSDGKMIVTIPNPYYALPTGYWKRGIFRRLFGRMPKLILKNYFGFDRTGKSTVMNENFAVRSYSLSNSINHATSAGWKLIKLEELRSQKDDTIFSLRYRLFRFPLLLLLVFEK